MFKVGDKLLDPNSRQYEVSAIEVDSYLVINEHKDEEGYSIEEVNEYWTKCKEVKLLWRRPVKFDTYWFGESYWFETKEQFMRYYSTASLYGPWESMDEPEVSNE